MRIRFLVVYIFSLYNLTAQELPFDFDARGMIVLSDADMVSSAYIDGGLNTEVGVQDALTSITWGKNVSNISASSLHVPNSVTNWVDGMDISKDGKIAFVVDTKGSLPRSIQKVENVFNELPQGNMLYAVDISNLDTPKLLDFVKVAENPLSVSVHPQTGKILVISRERGKEIQIVDFLNNSFGEVTTSGIPFKETDATHGIWHPTKNVIAITLEPSMEVAFLDLTADDSPKAIGKPIKIGEFAGAGKFSGNGNFYLIPDLHWNKGYNVIGELVSIAFSQDGKHKKVSSAEVGISPEGFAISPDGKYIIVSNMGTTFMPIDFELFGNNPSVTLLSFDDESGELGFVQSKEWKGILPEGVAFDSDGDMFVLTSFDTMDITNRRGFLSFWRLKDGSNGTKEMEETGFELSVTRGSHYVKVLK